MASFMSRVGGLSVEGHVDRSGSLSRLTPTLIARVVRSNKQIETFPDDFCQDRSYLVLCLSDSLHAVAAYQQVFFECGQLRSIGDQAEVVPLKIGVGNFAPWWDSGRGRRNDLTFFFERLPCSPTILA
jgi:hypothetical protein